jgi:hypothetical protein
VFINNLSAADFYYWDDDGSASWDVIGNWWSDEDATIPAVGLPDLAGNIYIIGDLILNSDITVANVQIGTSLNLGGYLQLNGYSLYVTGNLTNVNGGSLIGGSGTLDIAGIFDVSSGSTTDLTNTTLSGSQPDEPEYVTGYTTQSSENDILTFSFLASDNSSANLLIDVNGNIHGVGKTVYMEVPYDVDVTNLIANYTLSTNATASISATPQTSGLTANDFTNSVVYSITAEDASIQDWTIVVTIEAAPLTIQNASLAPDNSYIDITFSEGVWGDAGATTAVQTSCFSLVFDSPKKLVSNAEISGIQQTGGSPLVGGESTIRINLNITGEPEGYEIMAISPASGSSIYNSSGTPMNIEESTGIINLNQILAAPNATSATNITESGFTANWEAVNGATNYYLDVALNNSFQPVYFENQAVGNVTSTPISGLNSGTTYYYRLRAFDGANTSENSNIITVQTQAPPLTIQSATLASDNSYVDITFSEGVWGNAGATTAVQTSCFSLTFHSSEKLANKHQELGLQLLEKPDSLKCFFSRKVLRACINHLVLSHAL